MSNKLEVYKSSGLTDEEAKLVQDWVDSGRPGIHRVKADYLQSIYNLGYTCQEMHAKLPEYPLPAILWSRVHFEWDKRRDEDRARLAAAIPAVAADTRLDSIAMVSQIAKAVHTKWREDVIRYMSAPDREKAPDFLPTSLHQYTQLMTLLRDLTAPDKVAGQKGSGGDNPNAQGLPTINIQVNGSSVSVTEDRQLEVREALLRDVTETVKKDT